ncbi:helix-turn-helix domain-containing protein [Prochlorococcus marinus]|uniref:Transcriptional regulator n=1 Tax=Prochlorococcus marinus XMU1408 TaxID=2213228 RepID=A0A318RFD3_PROMR|nr:helix-turn-helix domain-containing protein [Prochlorococcus marinus]MBW3041485.1 transcriptional regulator [Prochlorococcus marinus str. XMU1408]PYE02643.1 transcriptional regulator [Prochlorococcus marinus XMU1408]
MEQSEGIKSDNAYIAEKKSSLQKVGEFLREARQGRSLSLDDLSSSLRIGKEQLIALEEGDERSLPEKVFIRAMVRRIAEKLNLDISFIIEELNDKKKSLPKSNQVINKKNSKKNRSINPFSMVILSGALGLFSSIMLLKYFQSIQNNYVNPQQSYIFLFDKNIYS